MDNSNLIQKRIIRNIAIKKLEKQGVNSIKILCTHYGDNEIYNGLSLRNCDVQIHGIDILDKDNALQGDGLQYIMQNDLAQYHIIDIDAYGMPFVFIEQILKKKYKGIIIFTCGSSKTGLKGGHVRYSATQHFMHFLGIHVKIKKELVVRYDLLTFDVIEKLCYKYGAKAYSGYYYNCDLALYGVFFLEW